MITSKKDALILVTQKNSLESVAKLIIFRKSIVMALASNIRINFAEYNGNLP